MFPRFCHIARMVNASQYVGTGWHTSRTKVIDNAIVGFSLSPAEGKLIYSLKLNNRAESVVV